MNLLYLVQSGGVGDAERQRLAAAQKELDRIAAITTHALRFYRQQSSPTPVSIPELFESVTLFQSQLSTSAKSLSGSDWTMCRQSFVWRVISGRSLQT